MQGALGEKLGEGAFSDVHAWAPGQVVKLFKNGFTRRTSRHEARMTQVVFAAGGPAPEVFGEVTVEGRVGIVLERLDGPTLLQHTRAGSVTPEQAGVVLANLYRAVHKTPPPPEVFTLRDWMDGSLRLSGTLFPAHILAGILTLVERLPPGDGLCHLDPHSSNVIMTADGPRLVDWGGAVRADAALDLACCHVAHAELAPELVEDPERPPAVNTAMQSEYARLSGLSPKTLASPMAPYLPIVSVLFLLGPGCNPSQRTRLMQRVEEAVRTVG